MTVELYLEQCCLLGIGRGQLAEGFRVEDSSPHLPQCDYRVSRRPDPVRPPPVQVPAHLVARRNTGGEWARRLPTATLHLVMKARAEARRQFA